MFFIFHKGGLHITADEQDLSAFLMRHGLVRFIDLEVQDFHHDRLSPDEALVIDGRCVVPVAETKITRWVVTPGMPVAGSGGGSQSSKPSPARVPPEEVVNALPPPSGPSGEDELRGVVWGRKVDSVEAMEWERGHDGALHRRGQVTEEDRQEMKRIRATAANREWSSRGPWVFGGAKRG